MLKMTSNFYPSEEIKNGYIGKANLTVGDSIRINGISVFDHDGEISMRFPEYERRDNGEKVSYVVPKSPEVYAAMLDTVKMAVNDEQYHFGHIKGECDPYITVSGKKVDEPLADGRFSIEVGDVCVLYGITTKVANKERDPFVAVDAPDIGRYTNRDNEVVYSKAFEGLVYRYRENGKEKSKDFAVLINNLVRNERDKLHNKTRSSFDNRLKNASKEAEKRNTSSRYNDKRNRSYEAKDNREPAY